MDKHNKPFTPETVDEQIDELLQSKFSTAPEAQIVQKLHHLYTEDANSLDHVWQRLDLGEHMSFSDAVQQMKAPQRRMTGLATILPHRKKRDPNNDLAQRPLRRSIAVLAAALMVALLTGSTLWGATHITLFSQSLTNQQLETQTPSGVYVGGGGSVVHLDRQTGKQIWKYSYPGVPHQDVVYATTDNIIPLGDTIYVAMTSFYKSGSNAAVLAIDAQTGKLRWSHPFNNASLGNMIAADGLLYASIAPVLKASSPKVKIQGPPRLPPHISQGTTIYALNTADGSQHAAYHLSWGGVQTTLSVANGILYAGANNGLYALSLADGKQLWYTMISGQNLRITTPRIVNDVLYTSITNDETFITRPYSRTSGIVAAFKASTGEQLWQSDPVSCELGGITVANNKVLVGTDTGDAPPYMGGLRAYDAQSGKLIWNKVLSGVVYQAPAVDHDLAYVGVFPVYPGWSIQNPSIHLKLQEAVVALNIVDGSIKWTTNVKFGFPSTPIVINGVVYASLANNNGVVINGTAIALKAADGSQIWTASSTDDWYAITVVS